MRAFAGVSERSLSIVLLAVAVACCLLVSVSTTALEGANDNRRDQLVLLDQLLADPAVLPAGPVARLDGLFGRRLVRVDAEHGPTVVFGDAKEASR